MKVLPTNVLEEDQDQGEMDTVFFLSVVSYTIYLSCIDLMYPLPKDKDAIGKFNLVMSNAFAFYPVMQAQGLWLKMILILTAYYSLLWHWTQTGLYLPGNVREYGRWDAIFSILSIVTYCMSWMPKLKTKIPTKEEERRSCWYHNCRGRPKETSEWRCRWTPNLVLTILIGIICSMFVYFTADMTNGMTYQILLCWLSVSVAVLSALYQLMRGQMKVGKRYRKNFVFWASIGVVTGCVSFVFKVKGNVLDDDTLYHHSIWHTYVMSSAYSFSRAAEYLEIY